MYDFMQRIQILHSLNDSMTCFFISLFLFSLTIRDIQQKSYCWHCSFSVSKRTDAHFSYFFRILSLLGRTFLVTFLLLANKIVNNCAMNMIASHFFSSSLFAANSHNAWVAWLTDDDDADGGGGGYIQFHNIWIWIYYPHLVRVFAGKYSYLFFTIS